MSNVLVPGVRCVDGPDVTAGRDEDVPEAVLFVAVIDLDRDDPRSPSVESKNLICRFKNVLSFHVGELRSAWAWPSRQHLDRNVLAKLRALVFFF